MTRIEDRGPPVAFGEREREAVVRCLETQADVVAAYLFGSQVTGTAGPLSDIDVAVWLDPALAPAERRRRGLELGGDLAKAARTNELQLVVLNDAPPLLQHRALRPMARLLDADPTIRTKLEARAILRYLDTAALREQLGRALASRMEAGTYGRRSVVEERVARLERELAALERIRAIGRTSYLESESLQREAERALQLSIQACIDIGAHLTAALGLGPAEDYADIFERLRGQASLDARLAARLEEASRQRNLLVHAYMDIDHALVWHKLGEADDLRAFAAWARRLAQDADEST